MEIITISPNFLKELSYGETKNDKILNLQATV
jgi:hypothetical protein